MGMCKFSHVKIVFEEGKGEIYTYIFNVHGSVHRNNILGYNSN